MMENPFVKPNCLKVDDYFKSPDSFMPFLNGAFQNINEMKVTFVDNDRLEITECYGLTGLQLKSK